MAAVIDATVSGTSANSYVTLVEADAYHEERLHNTEWTSATDANKNSALIWAANILDRKFQWKGRKKELTQRMDWPRYAVYHSEGEYLIGFDYDTNTYIIPKEIKDAQSELAFLLIKKDLTAELDQKGIKSMRVDVISMTFDESTVREEVTPSIETMLWELGTVIKNIKRSSFKTVPVART